ncbi:hypothetical protein [Streptomyces syringium]|uniref:hypothetical protein n=1 Tax=Streptomyces syringium TaxID=76729 RepID=UPI0033AE2559
MLQTRYRVVRAEEPVSLGRRRQGGRRPHGGYGRHRPCGRRFGTLGDDLVPARPQLVLVEFGGPGSFLGFGRRPVGRGDGRVRPV